MMCDHTNFHSNVEINRLEDTKQFVANITIECRDCHLPFQFLGLPLGLNLGGAAMSVDGQEAQLAIAPVGSVPSPFENRVQGFRVITHNA